MKPWECKHKQRNSQQFDINNATRAAKNTWHVIIEVYERTMFVHIYGYILVFYTIMQASNRVSFCSSAQIGVPIVLLSVVVWLFENNNRPVRFTLTNGALKCIRFEFRKSQMCAPHVCDNARVYCGTNKITIIAFCSNP